MISRFFSALIFLLIPWPKPPNFGGHFSRFLPSQRHHFSVLLCSRYNGFHEASLQKRTEKSSPWLGKILRKWPSKFGGFGHGMREKMRQENFFLRIRLTGSMVSGAEKNQEIIPLTWKNSWKVALKIRGLWPENEGENEATVLDFFLQIGLTESMASGACLLYTSPSPRD